MTDTAFFYLIRVAADVRRLKHLHEEKVGASLRRLLQILK